MRDSICLFFLVIKSFTCFKGLNINYFLRVYLEADYNLINCFFILLGVAEGVKFLKGGLL